jgi:sulfur-carrier protein
MARVTITGHFRQYTGGTTSADIDAANVRQLIERLGLAFPALAPHLTQGIAVAIDGQIFQDALLQPIKQDADVHILSAIAGG